MNSLGKLLVASTVALLLAGAPGPAAARTVYRCVQAGTTSLATAPEPGSKCTAQTIDDNAAKLPNLWGMNGTQRGTLYEREQDGKTVYSTRNLPGSTPVLQFAVTPPPGSYAHAGLGQIGAPQVDQHAAAFVAAAKASHVEDAWLRAIAHAESGFRADAVSNKGAQGVMQLMPATAAEYGVSSKPELRDPETSIGIGQEYIADLLKMDTVGNNLFMLAAAYNAGPGNLQKWKSASRHVDDDPLFFIETMPSRETRLFIERVMANYWIYQNRLGQSTSTLDAVASGASPIYDRQDEKVATASN